MRISRRLFVVPLANNDHGKTTMIRSMVEQGEGSKHQKLQKKHRKLVSPWGREIDAYVFNRSYQEVERSQHGSVSEALNQNDPLWRTRELVIMSSHVARGDHSDIQEMIDLAHSAGFDIIAVSVILTRDTGDNRGDFADIWRMNWDERWTVPNPWINGDPIGQNEALGRDLWAWVCKALAS